MEGFGVRGITETSPEIAGLKRIQQVHKPLLARSRQLFLRGLACLQMAGLLGLRLRSTDCAACEMLRVLSGSDPWASMKGGAPQLWVQNLGPRRFLPPVTVEMPSPLR